MHRIVFWLAALHARAPLAQQHETQREVEHRHLQHDSSCHTVTESVFLDKLNNRDSDVLDGITKCTVLPVTPTKL